MHPRQRPVRAVRRLIVATATACVLAAGIVALWDPTEYICALYTPSDPQWHFFQCWRFPPGGSPQG